MRHKIKEFLNKRNIYIIISLSVFLAGIAVLTLFKDSYFIRGIIGDFLVVIFLYFSFKSLILELSPVKTGAAAFLFALSIEFLQLFNITVRLNISNKALLILLGRTFDIMDIVAYFCGSCIAVTLDRYLNKKF